MSDLQRKKIEELFDKACSLPLEERKEFLDRQDVTPEILFEVEKLLEYDQQHGGGLTGNAVDQLGPTRDGSSGRPFQPQRLLATDSSSNSAIDHGRFLPGTMLADRYRIVGMLGKGGMGEVYRADDLELGQSVALKFLPERLSSDPRALERFRAEVRLARQVSHPNVCRVYDIGQIDGQLFLSMEYVDGEDLRQLLKRIGHFNPERAIELARQLCLGLHAAHEKGVLHRDLKPANIMIDGRGKLLITDFGLAEFSDSIRVEDIRSGTPAYMAPEQLAGREVTELSDIYSLGIILHELFTGKPAWEAESMAELLEKRSSEAKITSHTGNLEPAVESVIERCLEPDPQKRPDSALTVIASLPGGDPLAAALGAGETPSPQVVAAAGDRISLNSRLAVAGLVTIVLGLFLLMWVEDQTSQLSQSKVDFQPVELRIEAERMLKEEFGYEPRQSEAIYGFRWFPGVSPEPISFWYRQRNSGPDKDGFAVRSFWSSSWAKYSWARPDFFVPEPGELGETNVIMTGDKKLAYFSYLPEFQSDSEQEKTPPQWSKWFSAERTGFYLSNDSEKPKVGNNDDDKIQVLRQTDKFQWTPPGASDVVCVWEGTKRKEEDAKGQVNEGDGSADSNEPIARFFVVAAAYRGKPTYFRVIDEKDVFDEFGEVKQIQSVYESSRTRKGESVNYVVLLVLLAMVFGVCLAIHNLRSGHVDLAGGRRLAIYVVLVNFVTLFSFFHPTFRLVDIYSSVVCLGVAIVLFETARIWVWYVAIEPVARKVWPQILITTSRLLEGRFLDRLVGRDILAGIAFCIGQVIAEKVNVAIHHWNHFQIQTSALFTPLPISGPREFVGTAVSSHGSAFFSAIFVVMFLLMSRIILRSTRVGIIVAAVLLAPLFAVVIGGKFWITIFVAALLSSTVLYLVVRFGVLALLAFFTCRNLLAVIPLTLDPGKWYFGTGVAAIALVLAISVAAYQLVTSKKTALRTSLS